MIRMANVTRGAQIGDDHYLYQPLAAVPWMGPGEAPALVLSRTRTLPAAFAPGLPFTVSLSYVGSRSNGFAAIEEVPPAGWTVSNVSDGGIYDPHSRMIRWGVLTGSSTRAVGYTLTPPATASAPAVFEGRVSIDGNDIDFAQSALPSLATDALFRHGFESSP